jgi:hypothetical protein
VKPASALPAENEPSGQDHIQTPWAELDGYLAPQARVAGAIDLAHSACSERCEDFVGSEFRVRG